MTLEDKRQKIAWAAMESPIGRLLVFADGRGITEIRFRNNSSPLPSAQGTGNEWLALAIEQLNAYFNSRLMKFELPLSLSGTAFQRGVWRELQKINYGSTASYGQIAAAINKPKAARAVGMANNKNPIPIIIPCHRVIGSNGALIGFAGGLDTKRWLLQHEGVYVDDNQA
jgi:methylated-DNA-[protein]-cysteine S-methyltransferase